MSQVSPPYEVPLRIEEGDIDGQGHVNNVVYVRWVQEAAVAHWSVLAPPEEQEAVAWVLVRHEIDYKAAAFPGDEVFARTWVGVASGLTFERHVEILRGPEEKLLAKSRTLWAPISTKTGRPTRVSPGLRALFSLPG